MNEADVASLNKPKDGQKLSYNGAPILTGGFISEDAYVGSGYDKTPILFKRDAGGKWSFVKFLDASISWNGSLQRNRQSHQRCSH